ncbi:hypothetical protein ACFWUP_15545 [Nocardia sp. NPDC058658]|uniref:hypothetical protein n=1 Tax=Nocardia sp. NPDC058658 TaxID=3346580 RepID=UPI003651E338
MDIDEPFVSAVQKAVTPREADVLVARTAILAALADATEPVLLTDFEDRWLAAVGVRRPNERSTFTGQPAAEGRLLAPPDPSDPHLTVFRGRHAIRQAVAQLLAEGILARSAGNQYDHQPELIPITIPGMGTTVPVTVHSPDIGSGSGSVPRYMAVRPSPTDGSDTLLPVDELLADLDEILGVRGKELVRESRHALQRGLYLASSSLLAAASEAAWFNLARMVPSPPSALTKKVEEGREVAAVIQLTSAVMRERRITSTVRITEVVAQAHNLRDVRNYALHPVEPHDADRETWKTEVGATLLTISARRYFVKLSELGNRLSESA